jgi:glucokinase
MSSETYIGIEIGGSKLQVVAGEGTGKILRRWRADADRDRGRPGICEQLVQGIAQVRAGLSPRALGVGFGGPIDSQTGHIARSHQVHGWEDFALRSWLEELTHLPAVAENDSNTAALAEATRGAGAGANPVFYFNLGSGVGGGAVIGGKIYHGLPPGEAEFGHLRLDRTGATVESRCSGWAIDRRIRELVDTHSTGILARSIGPKIGGESRHLAVARAENDPLALRIVEELSDDLAFALSHVVHLFHPAVIVLGGGLSLLGEPLRNGIAQRLPAYVMEVFAPGPPIRIAALGEDAVPVGALILAGQIKQD